MAEGGQPLQGAPTSRTLYHPPLQLCLLSQQYRRRKALICAADAASAVLIGGYQSMS